MFRVISGIDENPETHYPPEKPQPRKENLRNSAEPQNTPSVASGKPTENHGNPVLSLDFVILAGNGDKSVPGTYHETWGKAIAMPQQKRIRALGYARVSTEEQANSGLSLVNQRIRIAALAKASDFELLQVIEEAGRTAKNMHRPGLQRALRALEDGQADALIVLSLDRLTRSVKDLGSLVEFFDRTKTALLSVQDSINTLSAAGRLVLNVLGSIAQWEREAIAERTSAAMAIKTQRGEKTGGTVPYGFDVDESGKLFPNTEEQEAIKMMIRCRRKGLSLRKIGELLLQKGFPPKKSEKWHPQVIKGILLSHVGKELLKKNRRQPTT